MIGAVIVEDLDPDALGAWCGIAAPLVLGTYLAVAARLRRGYDRTRDTMSALGDGVDVAAFGFLIVNAAVGVLLFLFAWRVLRPEFGWMWTIVAAGAVTSVVIGVTAGNESCALPGFYGRPLAHVHTIHLVVVGVALLGIGALPPIVWITGAGPDEQQFRVVNAVLAVLFVPVALAAIVLIVVGRRQLRSRLIHAGGRRPLARPPWGEPAVWLDRWGLAEYLMWTVGYSWVVAAAVASWRPGWVVASTVAFVALAAAATWWPQRIVPAVRFTVESCQQNTVHGVTGKEVVGELRALRISCPAAFRTSIRELLRDGTIVGEQGRSRVGTAPSRFTLTIGVTHDGLCRLGIPYRWRGPRPDVFAEGMWARRGHLGDAPDDWDEHWKEVHVGVWAYARDRAQLRLAVAAMDRIGGTDVVETIHLRRTGPTDPLPFNVEDGISQPWVLGVPRSGRVDPRGGGRLGVWGRWQPLALGEFVLGQVDEANDMVPVPEPSPLFIGGTFAAVRKLEIDQLRLAELLEQLSPDGDHQPTLDRLVGRRADGAPLVAPRAGNRIRYGSDPDGLACPITAHIRRANPRDALGFDGALANRRRLIRRGLSYVAGTDRGAPPEGVLFVSLQARLDDQFEFVQRSWLNDGAAFGLGRDPDALAGHWAGVRQVVLPGLGAAPPTSAMTEPLAVARGGAYFFLPSIRGVSYMAQDDGGR